MEKPKNNYQKLHPTHLAALREYIEKHGASETERRLGLGVNGLKNARRGLGIFPSTQAKILALIGNPAPPPPLARPGEARELVQGTRRSDGARARGACGRRTRQPFACPRHGARCALREAWAH